MKTPAPMRAAGRRALAAKGQALPGGQDPVPNLDFLKRAIRSVGRLDPAKRPALAALIRKRAKALKATNAPGVKDTWAFQGSNDTEAIDLAMSGRLPLIRGAADVQMRRTSPSVVTVQHASTGAKVGTLIPAASGYQGVHADGTKTPASGSMGGAMAGLIAYHNRQAAAKKLPPAQQDGTAVMAGSAKTLAGEQEALDLAGALPTYTSASSSTDGPRITSMSAGKKPASVPPVKLKLADQDMGDAWKQIYRKLIAKGLKPAQAAAMAKRAAAMHAKAAA